MPNMGACVLQAVWEAATEEELFAAFRTFAAFGAGSGTPKATGAISEPVLDGSRFAKCMRDSRLLGRNLTTTDVDLIFQRAKARVCKLYCRAFTYGPVALHNILLSSPSCFSLHLACWRFQ